jgi:methenyltetrahydrofolate cyclohydrolase
MEIMRFLERLASDHPTPGGGSASALAGALSASLVAMSAGLTLKKRGKTKTKEISEIRRKALAIQKKLSMAVDQDAASYEAVLKAFRLPKGSAKERLRRNREIQKAYQKATVIPQLVGQCSLELMKFSIVLIEKGYPNAVSDVGVAAFLADAALGGGLLNIGTNLAPIADKTFVNEKYGWMKRQAKTRNRLINTIMDSLSRVRSVR